MQRPKRRRAPIPAPGRPLLERLLDLAGLEGLDHVADLDVLVVLEHDAALETGLNLTDVVLEAAQGTDPAGPDHRALAHEPDRRAADEAAVADRAAGDRADARGLEELEDLSLAERLLDLLGLEHALHRRPQVLGHLVDHRVGADLDALALGGAASVGERADVEADDDGVGGRGEHDVGLVDAARGGADHIDDDLVLRELRDLVLERFERSGHVGLEQDVELVDLPLAGLREDLVERQPARLTARELLWLEARLALLGELPGAAVVLDNLDVL